MIRPLAAVSEALRSLVSHPIRSLLTAASVAFGAAVLFVLLSYATGVPEATTSILRSLGGKEMTVEPKRARGRGGGSRSGRRVRIRYADMGVIRDACPSIGGLAPTYSPGRGGPAFSSDNSWPWVRLSGVGWDYADVTDLSIVEGRWFSREDEVLAEDVGLISLPLAEGLYEGRSAIGQSVDTRGRRFEIIGVYESDARFAYSMFVPYTTAMEMAGDQGGPWSSGSGRNVSSLAFSPLRPDLAEDAVREIRRALGTLYSFDPNDTRAIDVKENIAFANQVEGTSLALRTLVWTIAAIALILGCLGAGNVVGIAVAERLSELGLRRAIGASANQVRLEVLAETLILSLAGGLAGIAIGAAAARLLGPLEFTRETRLVPEPDPLLFVIAVPLLVVTATLAGLPAAGRAARVDPAIALRSE